MIHFDSVLNKFTPILTIDRLYQFSKSTWNRFKHSNKIKALKAKTLLDSPEVDISLYLDIESDFYKLTILIKEALCDNNNMFIITDYNPPGTSRQVVWLRNYAELLEKVFILEDRVIFMRFNRTGMKIINTIEMMYCDPEFSPHDFAERVRLSRK